MKYLSFKYFKDFSVMNFRSFLPVYWSVILLGGKKLQWVSLFINFWCKLFPYSNYLIVQAKIAKLFKTLPVGTMGYVPMQNVDESEKVGKCPSREIKKTYEWQKCCLNRLGRKWGVAVPLWPVSSLAFGEYLPVTQSSSSVKKVSLKGSFHWQLDFVQRTSALV